MKVVKQRALFVKQPGTSHPFCHAFANEKNSSSSPSSISDAVDTPCVRDGRELHQAIHLLGEHVVHLRSNSRLLLEACSVRPASLAPIARRSQPKINIDTPARPPPGPTCAAMYHPR